VPSPITPFLENLKKRELPDGGFAANEGQIYRPDATAWAILALQAAGKSSGFLKRSRSRLALDQLTDGRIGLSRQHPEAFWPTPMAILAWQGSNDHQEAKLRAVTFLLNITGVHPALSSDSPAGHNTALKGWPWIENTHSWIEPTALSILALKISGHTDHPRLQEGVRMILDRQLPKGGWNYGNTTVFGQELYPLPDTTGLALEALTGFLPRIQIAVSLNFIKTHINRWRTPLALGWGLLGLGSWGEYPNQGKNWILESLKKQERVGPYDTSHLSLLIIAFLAPKGLLSAIG
jgi:hypothetical protein